MKLNDPNSFKAPLVNGDFSFHFSDTEIFCEAKNCSTKPIWKTVETKSGNFKLFVNIHCSKGWRYEVVML